MSLKEFKEKFKVNELRIYENEHWIWSLRPLQITLGSSILSLKRESDSMGSLTKEESKSSNEMFKIIENTLKSFFNYDKINYLILMMVDNQLHYHIIPRYSKKIEYNNISWHDNFWPLPVDITFKQNELFNLGDLVLDLKENISIKSDIKNNKRREED